MAAPIDASAERIIRRAYRRHRAHETAAVIAVAAAVIAVSVAWVLVIVSCVALGLRDLLS